METFQLLSRGGVKFDRKRFKFDVQLFDERQNSKIGTVIERQTDSALPPDVDFFKSVHSNVGKRPSYAVDGIICEQMSSKRPKLDDKQEGPSQPRQKVTAKGANVPEPIESFELLQNHFSASSRIVQNLKEYGYKFPTPIQAHATPILLAGRDLAAISPTGTGKTLSYLVPIMAALKSPVVNAKVDTGSGVRGVILAPTRELAHQIYNECMKLARGRKWRIILLSKATACTLADKSVSDKVDVLISTPLRLIDLLRCGSFHLSNVRHLVLDEADRLLDSEFLDQTQEVMSACTHEGLQKAAFSATLPSNAEEIVMGAMRDPVRVIVGLKDSTLPSISQKLVYVADESSKLPTLLQYLSQPYFAPIIIFTSTQSRAASLAEQLILNNMSNVDSLHAGMTMKQRQEAAQRMRNGDTWILVSTEVMARGMDFKGVRGVINFDFPTSVQSYIHRIGRTGRAGRNGTAVTYFTNEDAAFLKPIANVILQSGSTVPDWITKLPKLLKSKRRAMGKVKRAETVTKDDRGGRREAMKNIKEKIESSKKRKSRSQTEDVAKDR